MSLRLRLPVLLAVTLPALGACANGQMDAGPSWLRIAAEDAPATGNGSTCIGRPETPLCAVETLLACFQRNRPDLCRLVDAGADQYAEVFTSPSGPARDLAYRVVASRPDPTSPADDWTLAIEQQEVDPGQPPPPTPGQISLFRLHRGPDGRWGVSGWDDPPEGN